MSRYCCYELRGWNEDGMPLPDELKNEIYDMLDDLGAEVYDSEVPDGSPYIDSFSTETQSAAGEVHDALSAFSGSHPGVLLEMEFLCQEESMHSRIRYLNGRQESVDAVITFPPFQQLLIPSARPWTLTDDETFQHIRFLGDRRYECIDSGEKLNGLCFVCRRTINLNDYEMDGSFFEEYLQPYDYASLESLRAEYGDAADQIIAECIFETEMWEQDESVYAGTEEACRTYISAVVNENTFH